MYYIFLKVNFRGEGNRKISNVVYFANNRKPVQRFEKFEVDLSRYLKWYTNSSTNSLLYYVVI